MRSRRLAVLLTSAVLAGCGLPVTQGPGQNGAVCTTNDQCGSGICTEGVCCATACDGICVSCDLPGTEGTCTNVPDGEDPRHACGTGACAGVCDGTAACRYPAADTSCGEKVCAGDTIRQPSCDGAGHCVVASTPCAPYACDNAACLTTCADPLDCAVTGRCLSDGTCVAKLGPGEACASGTACASGYCADGVCCDKPCAGACEACNLPGTAGTCSFIPAGDDPGNECPGDAPCGASCDGAGHCAYGPAGTSCGNASCSAPDAPLVETKCNGAGACVNVQTSCGAYACQSGACRTSCGSSNECSSAAFCSNGQCVLKRTLGEACGSPSECLSANCVEGVCCSSGCGNACDSCVSGTPGLCSPLGAGGTPQMSCGIGQACGQSASCPSQCGPSSPCQPGYYCDGANTCQPVLAVGTACTANAQCGSGFCDDNVCCAEDCSNSPCRSCASSPSTLGQCLPLAWGTPSNCPGNYACQPNGECAVGACSDDRDCKGIAYCDPSVGCAVQKSNGATCSRARECSSGNCVDGVCCDTGCTGTCKACNVPGKTGQCSNVTAGSDPFLECPGGYACDGAGACNSSCTSNAQCESGFVCQNGACVGGKNLGVACASGSECSSGNCIDGVCCNTTCTGACHACNLPNTLGTCSNAAANTDPTSDCPGGNTCGAAGTCQASCTTNANCKSGYGCKGGACVLLAANGATCSVGGDCQSGFCADGVCCSSACNGKCEACNVPNLLGACVPFPAGTDPQGECTATSQTCNGQSACGTTCTIDQNCALGAYCNGGACAAKKTNGTACTANNQCSSSNCVDGVCCNAPCNGACRSCALSGSIGICTLAGVGTDPDQECPGGLACNNAGACNTTCSVPQNCESTYYCDSSSSSCVADLPQGAACTDPSQCPGNNCVDGYCCNSACNGTCQSCGQAGAFGTCTPYAARTDPQTPPECGLAYCSGSSSCLQPCGSDLDCKPGNYCKPGAPQTCTAQKSNGTACVASNECLSGNCVDGVCCNTTCTGNCMACNLGASSGTCSAVPLHTPDANCAPYLCNSTGQCANPCGVDQDCIAGDYCSTAQTCLPKKANASSCSANNECISGACADGVCCNVACNGTCQACNIPTKIGTCSGYTAGTDPQGECGNYWCNGSSACSGSCAGSDANCKPTAWCNGSNQCQPDLLAGAGQACNRANQCAGNVNCVDGFCCDAACNGQCEACNQAGQQGQCKPFPPGNDPANECGLYTCSGGSSCTTTCTTNTQCDTTNAGCVAGICTTRPNGTACTIGSQCTSGNCVDGVCCNTVCNAAKCQACNLTGLVGTCSTVPVGTDPDNECGLYTCQGTSTACFNNCTQSNKTVNCKSNNCDTSGGSPGVCQ